jgi:hypothetical protein
MHSKNEKKEIILDVLPLYKKAVYYFSAIQAWWVESKEEK